VVKAEVTGGAGAFVAEATPTLMVISTSAFTTGDCHIHLFVSSRYQ